MAATTKAKDAYDILGVTAATSEEEIHAAYRRLAKRWHPDLNPRNPQAEARFKEIAAAFALLTDAEQRAALDRARSEAAMAEPLSGSYGPGWRTYGTAGDEARRYHDDRPWRRDTA